MNLSALLDNIYLSLTYVVRKSVFSQAVKLLPIDVRNWIWVQTFSGCNLFSGCIPKAPRESAVSLTTSPLQL